MISKMETIEDLENEQDFEEIESIFKNIFNIH